MRLSKSVFIDKYIKNDYTKVVIFYKPESMEVQRRKIEVNRSTNKILTLQERLDWFLDSTKYIKKWPKFDELLQRKGYLSYIELTGSSGAGKTTQVTNIYDSPNSLESARNDSLFGWERVDYIIATRYITRKSRRSDNKTGLVENINIEREEFEKLVKNATIEIWRERDLWSEKVLYGFRSNWAISGDISQKRRKAKAIMDTDRPSRVKLPEQWGIIVYSGNNDMARNFDTIPFCTEHKDEFVHIHVQAQDNTERFVQRSQDVAQSDKKQLEKRASDDGLDVLAKAHIIVNNEPWEQEKIQEEIQGLMAIIAEYNKDTEKYKPQYTTDQILEAINPWFWYAKKTA